MDGLLQRMTKEGERAALAAFGLPAQPGLGSVGIKGPQSLTKLPPPAKMPLPVKPPTATQPSATSPETALGVGAAKMAFNVGMGASTTHDGAGSKPGDPADTARRQRSVIDRAFQRNEDDYASSSMPLPGDVVSP